MTFKDLCEQYKIKYSTACSYRKKHPKLTDEQVIQHYLAPKQLTFKEKCDQNNISYNTARVFKNNHPELTDEQVIQYYVSNSFINSQGELEIL